MAASGAISAVDDPRPTRLSYSAGLDGLRGVGVGAILLYHSGFDWFRGGFLGVSTFFTLSGFLITSLLLYEWSNTGRIDLARFWSRRFRRLLPGSLLALALITLVGASMGDANQVSRLRWDGLSALFFVSNWRFISIGSSYGDLFASPSLVQHFWSLSIEEQFYLLFPLFAILLLARGSRRMFAITITTLAVLSAGWMAILYAPDLPTSRLYYGTDTRAAEILLGILLALWHAGRPPLRGNARRAAIALGGVGLVGNLFFWTAVPIESQWLWRGGFLLYAILNAAIVLAAIQSSGPARALLGFGPLVWLGKVSYGVYIYHFPFFATLTPELTGLAPWPLFMLRVAATLAVAVPSYYWLERPIRHGRFILGRKTWLAAPVGVTLVIALLVVSTIDPPKPSVDLTNLSDPRRRVIVEAAPRIMIVGGSISFGIGKGLLRWATRTERASVFNYGRNGCGISRGGRVVNSFKRDADKCDNWPSRWKQRLAWFDPDVVIVLVGSWDTTERIFPEWGEKPRLVGDPLYDDWLLSEYEAALALLSSRGARVIWLTTPCHVSFGTSHTTGNPRLTANLNNVLRRVESLHGDELELVDFHAKVCPDGRFTNELAGMKQIRPDGTHFSDEAADWLSEWLGDMAVEEARRSGSVRDATTR